MKEGATTCRSPTLVIARGHVKACVHICMAMDVMPWLGHFEKISMDEMP